MNIQQEFDEAKRRVAARKDAVLKISRHIVASRARVDQIIAGNAVSEDAAACATAVVDEAYAELEAKNAVSIREVKELEDRLKVLEGLL